MPILRGSERYYVNHNAQDNGDHEVHKDGCNYLPGITNRIDLGLFQSCGPAVAKAKSLYPLWKINGCYWCALACHTT